MRADQSMDERAFSVLCSAATKKRDEMRPEPQTYQRANSKMAPPIINNLPSHHHRRHLPSSFLTSISHPPTIAVAIAIAIPHPAPKPPARTIIVACSPTPVWPPPVAQHPLSVPLLHRPAPAQPRRPGLPPRLRPGQDNKSPPPPSPPCAQQAAGSRRIA
ncbi:hypothetical protein GGS23DRAFT_241037 [Durotheca rogersii]|uniref:uncharacterized protein n=1 Tax=Durotheca rogersii TaxID=419775 RepID=UPI002221228E|nr:uncharacterized protein GGS23DRAFT_241037 [Durotheca rogersii]KAI5860246.1 hypothetical protein GGS23DRAFT_241037 [Durotheca rogersii]